MKKTTPLRMNYEFARVYRHGRFLSDKHVVLHYWKRHNGTQNRLGITASRKVKSSVRRNRLKRLLRESYRNIEGNVGTGYDLILVARQTEDSPNLAIMLQQVSRLFKRASLLRQGELNGHKK